MKSYISIHNFIVKKDYPSADEIRKKIKDAIKIQLSKNKNIYLDENGENDIIHKVNNCMKEYNKLLEIGDEGLRNPSLSPPQGILPKFTASILNYFAFLDEKNNNKEIQILEISGIKEIKIRYKHSDSVIKKLVKIAIENIQNIEDPLKVFLRGGKLHDLIGIDFICTYPYQREWVARALFNFFKIPDRTDYNLIYGFYKLDRESGYKALHCDKSYFKPSFDEAFIKEYKNNKINISQDDGVKNIQDYIVNKNYNNILSTLAKVFNIEIQIHTSFESVWSKMEHEKSYDFLTKGIGKNREIEVLWKILSDNLSIIESQFEHLQTLTEKSIIDSIGEKRDFNFIYSLLNSNNNKKTILDSNKKIDVLLKKLINHEKSRREYVDELQQHINELKEIVKHGKLTRLEEGIFKLQIAFIYYNYSNLDKYFNVSDMSGLLKEGIEYYSQILTANNVRDIIKTGDVLVVINAIVRYNRLTQKNGFGLIPADYIENFNNPLKQNTNKEYAIEYFQQGLHYMIELSNSNKTNYDILKKDMKSYLRTILYFYKMIMEIELDINKCQLTDNLSSTYDNVENLISRFKDEYINEELKKIFIKMISNNETTDISFIIGIFTMLIRNNLFIPIDGLKILLKISSSNKIRVKDLFFYEEASYQYLYHNFIKENKDIDLENSDLLYKSFKHYGDYHYENMIYLLYKMKQENIYEYYKAQIYFNKLVDNDKLYKSLLRIGKEKKHFDEAYFASKYLC